MYDTLRELLTKYQDLARHKLYEERRYEEAAEYSMRVIQCAELLGEWQSVVEFRLILGHVYLNSEINVEYAAQIYRKLIEQIEELGDQLVNFKEIHMLTQFALGRAYRKMGKLNQAIPILEEVSSVVNQPAREISILNDLGLAYWQKANLTKDKFFLDQAIQTYQRAIEITDQVGAFRQKAMVLNNKGMVFYEKQQYDDAIQAFNEALSITNDEYYVACISNEVAKTYLKLGNFHMAKQFINKANQILLDYDENLGEIELLRNLAIEGLYQRKIGNFEDAVYYFDMAATKLEDQELKIEAAETFHQLSLMLKERGDIRSGRYALKFEELAKDIEENEQRLVSN